MNKEIKELYSKLMYKGEFKRFLSNKMGVGSSVVESRWLCGDVFNVPKDKQLEVLHLLTLQVKLEDKIKEIKINYYNEL